MTDKTLGAYERHESPDDMDGGVAAALIEKEADGRMLGLEFRARFLSDDRDYWKGRAEKAETKLGLVTATSEELEEQLAAAQEDRDRVFDLVRDADMGRDLAVERAEKAEQERDHARRERDSWRAQVPLADWEKELVQHSEQSRPLTPDAITDEMVERARNAPSFDGRLSPTPRLVREMLTAALTEPPARPEGAEELEDAVAAMDINFTPPQIEAYADLLASRGVRVVGEDGAA